MTLNQGLDAMYAFLQRQPVPITIGFIGAGKVGVSLGKYFLDRGVPLSGYYSLTSTSSQQAVDFTGTYQYLNLENLFQDSSVIFFTVPDNVIQQVYKNLGSFSIKGKCLIHCSGSLSSQIFEGAKEAGARSCSLHPICAVSNKYTGHQSLEKAFFTIEGDDVEDIQELIHLCGNKIEAIPAHKKVLYHGAAVFASNLVVGLYHKATEILEGCGLSYDFAQQALLPLFVGNSQNIAQQGVVAALTGPVERGDSSTIANHLQVLSHQEREIYRLLSCEILELARKKNPSRNYFLTEEILKAATGGHCSLNSTQDR